MKTYDDYVDELVDLGVVEFMDMNNEYIFKFRDGESFTIKKDEKTFDRALMLAWVISSRSEK